MLLLAPALLEKGRKVEQEMGSCASVHKEDSGFQKNLFLGSPHKAKAANGKAGGGGGVAPVGDGFGDLKYKIEVDQPQADFGPKTPDSGMRAESLLSWSFSEVGFRCLLARSVNLV